MEQGPLTQDPKRRRVLLKLSGAAFSGCREFGIDQEVLSRIAGEIVQVAEAGVELAIVVGGGNMWRGSEAAQRGMDRATADYAGMIATVINALALQDTLEQLGLDTRAQTAIGMAAVAEPFIRRRAIRHLEKGRTVIFAAGTGNPFFTTDTAAVLRAVEIGAEVIFKATNVDGVYDRDPRIDNNAQLMKQVDYLEALSQGLKVMDATAISLSMDNRLPIIVFNITTPGNIARAVLQEDIGTLVGSLAREGAGPVA